MTNRPLTEKDFKVLAGFDRLVSLKNVQAAKRLFKMKITDRYFGNDVLIRIIRKEIDACFQISDGDDKDG